MQLEDIEAAAEACLIDADCWWEDLEVEEKLKIYFREKENAT